jgi:hypothetical protein
MNYHDHTGRHTIIDSPTTIPLMARLREIEIRQPRLAHAITEVRNGDDGVLRKLVADAQAGDKDAAVAAIGALLPKLSAVVIRRYLFAEWRGTIDEYVALAYLTIAEIGPYEAHAFLGDKIVARTRRRHERAQDRRWLTTCDEAELEALGPEVDDVEAQALAYIELLDLVRAVDGGLVTKDAWFTLLDLRIGRSPDRKATPRERTSVSRSQRRLDSWRAHAA